MEQKLVVIVHGTYGYPQENWFPWLADKVRSMGHRALVPMLPTPRNQSLESWRTAFESQVGTLTPNMILVGHSLGPAFIFHLLQASRNAVTATFLVSAFVGQLGNDEFDRLNKSFFVSDFDWTSIKRNGGKVYFYHGDDDPYVALDSCRAIARMLDAPLKVIPGGGHLNTAAGFGQFEMLLADLVPLLDPQTSHTQQR